MSDGTPALQDRPVEADFAGGVFANGYLDQGELTLLRQLKTILAEATAARGRGLADQARIALALTALLVSDDLRETERWDEAAIARERDQASLSDLLAIYAFRGRAEAARSAAAGQGGEG